MEKGLFAMLGRLVVHRRWLVVIASLVVFAALGSLSAGLEGRLSSGGFEVPGSESLDVQNDLSKRFTNQSPASTLVVIHHDRLSVDDPSYLRRVREVFGRIAKVPGVASVDSMLNKPAGAYVSRGRHTTFLSAGLMGGQDDWFEASKKIEQAGRSLASGGFTVVTGGTPAFFNEFNEISKQDLAKAEQISFPITLLLLVVTFASVVAAGLPILLALFSLGIAFGVMYLVAGFTDVNAYATNTATTVGIGVGIDYALFVVTRFREELAAGFASKDAVPRALATSGRAVALSGATVIVALAGMFVVDVQAIHSMAIGSMTAVAIAVVGAVILLPAVLAILGGRINKLRVPFVQVRKPQGQGFWHDWSMAVMRRPWMYLAASLAVLVLLGLPLLSIRFGQPAAKILPEGSGPRVAAELLGQNFGEGTTGPIEVLVETPQGAHQAANLADIDRLTKAISKDPQVAFVQSLTNVVPDTSLATYQQMYAGSHASFSPELFGAVASLANWTRGGSLARISVTSKAAPESLEAEALLERVRERYIPAADLSSRARVGGFTASNVDFAKEISSKMPWVIGVVLALSFVLLAMAFRSLLLPLKAIVMNLLSVSAAYGLIVALFQWGWGESLLGFTSSGYIEVWIPLFLFCILFGLSMDYEVFLLSRMREVYMRTGNNEQAVALGLESTARTITSAALIMITVFAAFAMSRLMPFKEFGIGLAAAVFIDATLVRVVLVPAAMKLMGKWNWWMPRGIDRWLPRIALESSTEASSTTSGT